MKEQEYLQVSDIYISEEEAEDFAQHFWMAGHAKSMQRRIKLCFGLIVRQS